LVNRLNLAQAEHVGQAVLVYAPGSQNSPAPVGCPSSLAIKVHRRDAQPIRAVLSGGNVFFARGVKTMSDTTKNILIVCFGLAAVFMLAMHLIGPG
jgi:hypothetical protein